MAHAGTPADLAKQPAATGTGQGFWQALGILVAVVAIALAMVAATSFIASSNVAKSVPAADRSYDQIEAQRLAAPVALPPADLSRDTDTLSSTSDQFKGLRGTRTLSGTSITVPVIKDPVGQHGKLR
jgi:hypothetical protein